jgi:hypothetical protein
MKLRSLQKGLSFNVQDGETTANIFWPGSLLDSETRDLPSPIWLGCEKLKYSSWEAQESLMGFLVF